MMERQEMLRQACNEALDNKIYSQRELAALTGVDQGVISRFKKGKQQTLNPKAFNDMIEALKNRVQSPLPESFFSPPAEAGETERINIPLYADTSSRAVLSPVGFRRDFLVRYAARIESLVIVHALDNSMHPTIRERSQVLVDQSMVTPEGGKIFYVQLNGQTMIRRVETNQDGALVAIHRDADSHRLEITEQDTFKIIGRCLLQVGEL